MLVAASFAAFFVSQRLKSAPPVIRVRGMERFFSPNGDRMRDVDRFRVRLKVSDDVTVDVVDAAGDPVRRLADGIPVQANQPLRLAWRGDTDAGGRAPDGVYRLRVSLRREGRSAIVPRTMTVDTRAPHPVITAVRPGNVVAPGSPVTVFVSRVSPRYITRFKVLRTDLGRPRVVATFTRQGGSHRAVWDGLVNGAPAPQGLYLIQVTVRDHAGNRGVVPARVEPGAVPGRPGVTVRGIAAQPPLRPVTAGARAQFLVDARGRPYQWSLRRVGESRPLLRGRGRGFRVVIRAPRGPSGAYLLALTSRAWRTTVPLLVQAQQKAPLLVVVPAITWLGSDRIDDPPWDGVPNSLDDGGPVQWPRVLRGIRPAGFAGYVAPLLTFLDRERIRYDLTSDLDLALTRNPRASDRPGVLLAGPERWTTRALAHRLRRYVLDGGRLASFGVDSLRRGVSLRVNAAGTAGQLSSPTQPTAVDPFGARLGRLRTTAQPATLTLVAGDPNYPLLTGIVSLPGFRFLEESAPTSGREKMLAGLGQEVSDAERARDEAAGRPSRQPRPALTAVQLGKGLVIRVGLPQWTQHLGRPDLAQVTRNIVDLLRGATPKIG